MRAALPLLLLFATGCEVELASSDAPDAAAASKGGGFPGGGFPGGGFPGGGFPGGPGGPGGGGFPGGDGGDTGDTAPPPPDGEALYAEHCASCHGDDGLGVEGLGPSLLREVERHTDDQLANTILTGDGTMPAIPVTEEEAYTIVAYLHELLGV